MGIITRIRTLFRQESSVPIVVALVVISLVLHLISFIFYSANPLGYDSGFYRRYLIQPFVSFPNAPVPGLGADALLPRLILDALRFLHVPTNLALYGSYIAFFTILPILFFFWLKPYLGVRGALIGGLLLVLSPVGYTAYWYMLYKNAFALIFLLLAFVAYERRLFWPLILLDIGIALSHKTTAIIYMITLIVLLVIDYKRWREIVVHVVFMGICFALIIFNISIISSQVTGNSAVAIFIEWKDYIVLSVPIIITALCTVANWKNIHVPRSLIAFALASFAFPIFALPFYQRIFVFTDIALIAFAAYGLDFIISQIKFDTGKWLPRVYFLLVCVIWGLQIGNLETQVRKLQPIESGVNLDQIAAIGALIPADALLLTTNDEAPWYEGWTRSHIAAPGMLHDVHNFDMWTTFWESTSTTDRIVFLNTFPKPLYISTLGDFADLIGNPLKCLAAVAPKIFRNDCE